MSSVTARTPAETATNPAFDLLQVERKKPVKHERDPLRLQDESADEIVDDALDRREHASDPGPKSLRRIVPRGESRDHGGDAGNEQADRVRGYHGIEGEHSSASGPEDSGKPAGQNGPYPRRHRRGLRRYRRRYRRRSRAEQGCDNAPEDRPDPARRYLIGKPRASRR
jgi:hypothetical protein